MFRNRFLRMRMRKWISIRMGKLNMLLVELLTIRNSIVRILPLLCSIVDQNDTSSFFDFCFFFSFVYYYLGVLGLSLSVICILILILNVMYTSYTHTHTHTIDSILTTHINCNAMRG